MNYKTDFALIVMACLLAGVTPSRADELAEKGRDIFTKNQRAIVTVEVVQKTSYTSPGRSSSPN
jgi:hypothetical protein